MFFDDFDNLFSGMFNRFRRPVLYQKYYSVYKKDKGYVIVFNTLGMDKDDIKIISLAKFNKLGGFKYKNTLELIYNPPKLNKELKIRKKIAKSKFDISPIIVIDEIKTAKYTLQANSEIFPASIEVIKVK